MTQKRDKRRPHKHDNESSDSTKSAEFFCPAELIQPCQKKKVFA